MYRHTKVTPDVSFEDKSFYRQGWKASLLLKW